MSAQNNVGEACVVLAGVILIGNELLSGRTQDSNLTYLAKALNDVGVQVGEVCIIRDDEATIIERINEWRQRFDYVFTTGGIGPTHDDITSASVARAFGVELVRNRFIEAQMRKHYGPERVNAARLKMADIPAGAALIANSISIAPGFRIQNVFVMAGVPRIMQAMLDEIAPHLRGGKPVLQRAITASLPEGEIAHPLSCIQDDYADIEIGSYPYYRSGEYGTSLVLRASDEARLEEAAHRVACMVRELERHHQLGVPPQ